MVLYDDQENKQKKLLSLLFIAFIVIIITITYLFVEFKPLPKNDLCTKEGYNYGEQKEDFVICYSQCEKQSLNTCKIRKVFRE